MFGIFIDPTKCKGCAECVEVCADLGYNALTMIAKKDDTLATVPRAPSSFYRKMRADTPKSTSTRRRSST